MDEILRTADQELRTIPGVRLVLATAGGGFIGGVSEGRIYVQLLPHEERVFTLGLLLRKTLAGRPLEAFTRLAPQKKIMQEARKRFKKYRDLRASVRNLTGFNIGGSSADIDFVLRGPDLQALFTYSENLRTRSEALGIMDADTTLKLDKPELRIRIDRPRPTIWALIPAGSARK